MPPDLFSYSPHSTTTDGAVAVIVVDVARLVLAKKAAGHWFSSLPHAKSEIVRHKRRLFKKKKNYAPQVLCTRTKGEINKSKKSNRRGRRRKAAPREEKNHTKFADGVFGQP